MVGRFILRSANYREVDTSETQMPVRGPANRVSPILHDYESMSVGQGESLAAEPGERLAAGRRSRAPEPPELMQQSSATPPKATPWLRRAPHEGAHFAQDICSMPSPLLTGPPPMMRNFPL